MNSTHGSPRWKSVVFALLAFLEFGGTQARSADSAWAALPADQLRIGFAKRDISPPVLPEGDLSIPLLGFRWERSKAYREIHDPLYARVMAVAQGETKAVIFACDLFGDAVGFGNRCAAEVRKRYGIPEEHVFFSCTHTHTAPDTLRIGPRRVAGWWIDRLVDQLTEAAGEALRAMQPGSLRWGQIPCAGWAVNRRVRYVQQYEKKHGPLEAEVRARATAVDETLRVLWAADAEGRPLGAVMHFAAHPVIMQTAPLISADYCGVACRQVEAAFGRDFVCLYINGPCGDINPVAGDTRDYRDCQRMGFALAEKAIGLIRGGEAPVADGPICGRIARAKVQRQKIPDPAALQTEEKRLQAECAKADAAGLKPQDPRHPLRKLQGIREVLAVEAMPLVQEGPVHVLRVGEVGFISFPGELFCVLGEDVRRALGGKLVLAECSRSHLGYLYSREAFRIGGYEIGPGTWSWLAPGAGETIVQGAIQAAQQVGLGNPGQQKSTPQQDRRLDRTNPRSTFSPSPPPGGLEPGRLGKDRSTAAGWVKWTGNPVLGGPLGSCFDVALFKEGDTFRMWFSWRPKKSIALVESKDGIHWGEPVIVLGPNQASGWEDDINRPIVVRCGDGYHMFYTGQTRGHSWIGYARSADGKTWKRMSDQPVLSPEAPWEKVAVMCPHVIWDDTAKQFRMWYSGGEQYEPDAIGYATSPNGLTWQKWKSNPIFAADPKVEWERHKVTAGQVVWHGGWHVMFYIGFRDVDHAQIGLARSRDGITRWQRHPANPIIRPTGGAWDADACYKPFAILEDNRWLLWYNGRRGHVEQIGLAIHDGEDLGFPR